MGPGGGEGGEEESAEGRGRPFGGEEEGDGRELCELGGGGQRHCRGLSVGNPAAGGATAAAAASGRRAGWGGALDWIRE